jgi:hypothetical protein
MTTTHAPMAKKRKKIPGAMNSIKSMIKPARNQIISGLKNEVPINSKVLNMPDLLSILIFNHNIKFLCFNNNGHLE